MRIYILFIIFIFLLTANSFVFADDDKESAPLIRGYITNRFFNPIKLKVFNIESPSFFYENKSLEDNSYVPEVNLKLTAENVSDYMLVVGVHEIFIPKSTKLSGYISDVIPPGRFNKKGFFKVTFNEAICPDGKVITLENEIVSKSSDMIYNPVKHAGKTTLGLLSGGLAGALIAYQLGGLGLAVASHGYSLAAGAATGGFLGTIGGLASKGKESSIEPGTELTIAPIDDISLIQLKQITCSKSEIKQAENNESDEKVKIDIVSVKKKKLLGETVYKLNVKVLNNTENTFRLNNFFLRDSQGKEYSASIVDFNDEIFVTFLPSKESTAQLEFFVDHPKANYWLVLKDKNYSKEIGQWELVK